jgi:hypothetical protein
VATSLLLGTVEEVTKVAYFRTNREDTIVLALAPSKRDNVFVEDRCFYDVQMSPEMVSHAKYMAVYLIDPISAITEVVEVVEIRPDDHGSFTIYIAPQSQMVGPIRYTSGGNCGPIRSKRYAQRDRLDMAQILDELWPEPEISLD